MNQNLWLLVSALLVFLMQAGFMCLESGRTRSKNSINVAAKNISDFVISSIIFWLFGFALMFGDSLGGLIGHTDFSFGEHNTAYQTTFFIFQMMFCSTAATLTSGAVAERTTFNGYLFVTLILSATIYPVTGHWAWAGLYSEHSQGWLEALGFVDFAGSTVVHSVGGWVALAAVLIIGPRLGRFDSGHSMPPGNNLPMSALGTLLIWFGWFGFNGGSTLAFTEQVPLILLNTCLAAFWGGLTSTTIYYVRHQYVDVAFSLNGIIAGLVGITAGCHAVSPAEAALIGAISGAVLYGGSRLMEWCRIDDALDVVPAHLFAGIWGTLAVALFGDAERLGTGLAPLPQLGVQALGVLTIGAWGFGVSWLLMKLADRFVPLRVSADNEKRGLNITEHRATTELLDLLNSMEAQQSEGRFTKPVAEEPFTEVGQIANRYNQVIKRVNAEIQHRDMAIGQFRASEKRKNAILQSSMDCIISIDSHGRIIEFNTAAERTFDCPKKQVQGRNFIDHFVLPEDRDKLNASLSHRFSDSHGPLLNRRNTLQLQRSSGQSFPAEITITNTRFTDREGNEFTLHVRDATRQMKMQERLQTLAYNDPLTNLSNRAFLQDKLKRALVQARSSKTNVALLFLDLDKFKKINDTLGHSAGDQLLCEVASRLTEVARETDTIARWGGDEFVVLMSGDIQEHLLIEKAETILAIMRNPVEIQGKPFNIPTSIGLVLARDGDSDADTMLQQADIAMYAVKQGGRNNYCLFVPEMAEDTSRRLRYEEQMRENLDSDQFTLVYQPRIRHGDNRITGLEALLRWHHPEDGLLPPAHFIPLAEESDLIILLGERVIHQALSQVRQWLDRGKEIAPVAVNISGRHLISPQLVPYIRRELEEQGVPGCWLEVEITENVLVEDFDRCVEVIRALKELEIRVSVDDFGTGYSSLSYLKRLPVDTLKIDQSFVADCHVDEDDVQICTTIINLADSLGLTTVAEGVENAEQVRALLAMGCEVFQGYYFHEPLAPDQVESLLQASGNRHSAAT